MKYSLCLIILFLISCSVSVASGQNSSAEAEIIPADAARCQRNTINVANLKQIARIKNQKVFVIAHLGSKETSLNISRRRLKDIGAEFDQVSPMSRANLILAEGERVKGQGRVDVYLGSEVYFVSYVPVNGTFCSLCCDTKREFYTNVLNHERGRKRGR